MLSGSRGLGTVKHALRGERENKLAKIALFSSVSNFLQ